MKTTITSILIGCSLGFSSFGQTVTTQSTQNSQVKFYASNNGVFFHNTDEQAGGYFVPKDSLISSIYNMRFAVVGQDVNGQIRGAVGVINDSDFAFGPIADVYTDTNYTNRYGEQLWEVYRSEIQYHIDHWMDQNYTMPANIANWPGNGIVTNGESQKLAPFYDVNGDDNYQPGEGDYPLIRGDKAMYTIFNDHKLHTGSGMDQMGIEVHVMFYQFAEMLPSALSNTVFMYTSVYNRGAIVLYDTYMGHFIDFDLGDMMDDIIGTNPDKQLTYVMNADLMDGPNSGHQGFGVNPPSVGVIALDGNMSSSVLQFGSQNNGTEYYNVLRGLQSDGSPYLDLNGDPTVFTYSELDSAWFENNSMGVVGDRRSIIGYESGTLQPYGGRLCLNNAIVYARSQEGHIFSSTDSLFAVTDYIQDFFDDQMWGCEFGGLSMNETAELDIVLYPNPAQNEISIKDIKSGSFRILSLEGKLVAEGMINHSAIDVTNLKAGCYMIEVSTSMGSDNRFGVQRFVKE